MDTGESGCCHSCSDLCSGVGKDSDVDSRQYPMSPAVLSLQWCTPAPRRLSGAHPGKNVVGWM